MLFCRSPEKTISSKNRDYCWIVRKGVNKEAEKRPSSYLRKGKAPPFSDECLLSAVPREGWGGESRQKIVGKGLGDGKVA